MSGEIVVRKLNLHGEETWRYTGKVLSRAPEGVVLEALFNRDLVPVEEIVLKRGDHFVESFYTDRWYNIFEIHHGETIAIKGWYCNIAKPAVITDDQVSYVDLALDLLVYPDGRQVVLDEDEFAALPLDELTRKQALEGMEALKRLFYEKIP
ncbi:MAG TPA: DUF402 domain-containing protein [Anaerolineaceae bacterium]|nr:DUF402 domain-containing protein [Anaerolineaceae bacterium]